MKYYKFTFIVFGLIGTLLSLFYIIFYTRTKNEEIPLDNSLPTMTWGAHLDLLREQYDYPDCLRESLLTNKWFYFFEEMDPLIDPMTIARDEWNRYIEIAFQDINSLVPGMEFLSKEATVIDFTENFAYVLFLLPKMKEIVYDADFLFFVKINRQTDEVLKRAGGYR